MLELTIDLLVISLKIQAKEKNVVREFFLLCPVEKHLFTESILPYVD